MGKIKINGNVCVGNADTFLLKNIANRPYGTVKFVAFTIDSTNTSQEGTITLTTSGRPVYLICTGDLNPGTGTDWAAVSLYRDGTFLKQILVQGTASSRNNPFAATYLDDVAAGTHVYKVYITQGRDTSVFGEDGCQEAPTFSAWEI